MAVMYLRLVSLVMLNHVLHRKSYTRLIAMVADNAVVIKLSTSIIFLVRRKKVPVNVVMVHCIAMVAPLVVENIVRLSHACQVM